jgi:hypothetical protein
MESKTQWDNFLGTQASAKLEVSAVLKEWSCLTRQAITINLFNKHILFSQ